MRQLPEISSTPKAPPNSTTSFLPSYPPSSYSSPCQTSLGQATQTSPQPLLAPQSLEPLPLARYPGPPIRVEEVQDIWEPPDCESLFLLELTKLLGQSFPTWLPNLAPQLGERQPRQTQRGASTSQQRQTLGPGTGCISRASLCASDG